MRHSIAHKLRYKNTSKIFSTATAFAVTLAGFGGIITPNFITAQAHADNSAIDFNSPTYSIGNINNQNNWSKSGPYDAAVAANNYGYATFGDQSLRISNAITSGSFGNQTFVPPLSEWAGEPGAWDATNTPVAAPKTHFESQFDIASATGTEQTGLAISVSPDNGVGARMSYLRFEDHSDGIHVYFDDVTDPGHVVNGASFNETEIAILPYATPHTIKISMDFIPGPDNDIVTVFIDGTLAHTGTSWEDYYRYNTESNPSLVDVSRAVKTMLFRAGGPAAPSTLGSGYLVDNVMLSTSTPPPAVPTNLSLKTSPGGANIAINGYTNSYGVVANWAAVAGADHYMYKYWNSISGSPYDSAHPYVVSTATTSRSGVFNQGEGQHFIAISACDAANNCSAYSAPFAVTYDASPPSAPNIIAPTEGHYYSSQPILNKWSVSTDTLSGLNRYQIAYLYDDGHTFGSSTCPGIQINGKNLSGCRDTAATQRNHTPALTEQGGVTIWVRAFDNAGNISDWSTPIHYYYDTTVLSAPNLLSPADGAVVKGASLTNSWSPVDHAVKYQYQSYDHSDLTGLRWDHEYTATSKTATNVADGTVFYWRVRAIDQYGLTGPWSALWKVTVDNIAPVINSNFDITLLTGETVTLNPTITDASQLTYSWTVSDEHILNKSHAPLNEKTLDIGPSPKGDYTATLTVTDAAGNSSSATFNITIYPHASTNANSSAGSVNSASSNTNTNTNTNSQNQSRSNTANSPQVLGAETSLEDTSSPTTPVQSDTPDAIGHVEGASTDTTQTKIATDTPAKARFLGLGWWWLAVAAGAIGLWLAFGRRNTDTK